MYDLCKGFRPFLIHFDSKSIIRRTTVNIYFPHHMRIQFACHLSRRVKKDECMCHLGDNVPCAHAMLVFLVKAVCVAYQLLLVMPLGWCYRNLVSWNPLDSICVSIETMLGNWIENSLWTIPLHSWSFLIATLLHAIFSGWSIVFY